MKSLVNTLLALSSTTRITDLVSWQTAFNIHRRLVAPSVPDVNFIAEFEAASTPQALFNSIRTPLCGADRSDLTALFSFIPDKTMVNTLIDCACSRELSLSDPSLQALYEEVKAMISNGAGEADVGEDMTKEITEIVHKALDALPAIMSSQLVCSSDCQAAWKALGSYGLGLLINDAALAPAQAALVEAGLPKSQAVVTTAQLEATTDAVVTCMCGGSFDYSGFVNMVLPDLAAIMNDMPKSMQQGSTSAGAGAKAAADAAAKIIAEATAGSASRTTANSREAVATASAAAIAPTTANDPKAKQAAQKLADSVANLLGDSLAFLFSSGGLCGAPCQAMMLKTSTLMLSVQRMQAGALLKTAPALDSITRTALTTRVDAASAEAPRVISSGIDCLCGGSMQWKTLVTSLTEMGVQMWLGGSAAAPAAYGALIKRALRLVFGTSGVCGGKCPCVHHTTRARARERWHPVVHAQPAQPLSTVICHPLSTRVPPVFVARQPAVLC